MPPASSPGSPPSPAPSSLEPGLDVFGDVSAPCAVLAAKNKFLGRALDAIGAPHIRRRPGGFEGLFRIIVEQQVSVPSAQAIWARCRAGLDPVTPEGAAALGAAGLKAFGLSSPKARYVLCLAEALRDGLLDFEALARLDDEAASAALQRVKGVGPWSAGIYLLFCEGRIDIWPPGDVALLAAYRAARQAARAPGPAPTLSGLDARAAAWTPHRGLAAHILWTYYAHLRGRAPI